MGDIRNYKFSIQKFEKEIAHGGKSSILTKRAFKNSENSNCSNCNFIDLTIVPPGGDIGIHTHNLDNEEIYIIISGEGKMVTDGEKLAVTSGDIVFNKPGGTHGLWNIGKTEIKLVVIEIAWRQ